MGEVFAGRYELVDVLGHGGMGDVWRVWDHRDGAYRAAKLLRQVDGVSLMRFVRESSWRVDHPHVLMPVGWAGEDDRVLFTMPVVPGGSVATVLADHGTVPWSWARPVLEQVLSALEAVHAAGLVHRDLKPANVLLAATGTGVPHAYLSDFGIAVHRDEPRLTRAHESLGTRGYQAPEAEAGADPDPAHDFYALGVLARELLGALPRDSVLARLSADDPVERPAAAQVRAALSATPAPEERDEPVEVFEQLPALPPDWTPAGPTLQSRTPSRDLVLAALLAAVGLALLVAAVVAL